MDVVAALHDTQHAFDGVASAYHETNVENDLLAAMRTRFRDAVERYVPRGGRLLDLGCGPGTDEEHFAVRGYRVTAIDWSPAMVRQARRRVRAAGLADRVTVQHLGIHELDRLGPTTFDGACSNLGPLNCVADLDATARLVADRIRPGGWFVASVIGRVCPWEIALFAARADWKRIGVRFAAHLTPVPLEGRTVWTRYYAPAAFARTFAHAGFEPVAWRALGVFVPPPYMQAYARRHPRLVAALQAVEDVVGGWPIVRGMGDHFLIAMRRM